MVRKCGLTLIYMSSNESISPRISRISWGNMTIQGIGTGKDFKLWPGGGRDWNWNETNTHHIPGIQPADLQELIAHGAEVIVLSRGMLLALQTCPESKSLLESKGIKFHIAETKKASDIYNHLADAGVAVGGLFHSTC